LNFRTYDRPDNTSFNKLAGFQEQARLERIMDETFHQLIDVSQTKLNHSSEKLETHKQQDKLVSDLSVIRVPIPGQFIVTNTLSQSKQIEESALDLRDVNQGVKNLDLQKFIPNFNLF